MAKESNLSYDQQLFVVHYMLAKQQKSKTPCKDAALAVGVHPGTGRNWMTQNDIKEAIREQYAKVAQPIFDKYVVTQEKIIQRYAQIAFHDPADVIAIDPETGEERYLKVTEMDEYARMGVGAKVSDVRGALDSLSRIEGMFQDNLNVKTFGDILKEVEDMDGSDEPLVADQGDDDA